MFSFFVTKEGGLTTAGYSLSIVTIVLMILAAFYFSGKSSKSKQMSIKQIIFCSLALALAFVSSYIKLFSMPFGGTVTLFSMLFIVLIGNWYGLKVGILTGFAYGILQFIQEPYVLSLFQVCCDYIFAFAALGLSGLFAKSKNGLIKGYLAAVLCRGLFHSLGGYLYWMSYMPETFPKSLSAVYPLVYNYSYLLAEAALTLILLNIPAIKHALIRVKENALS